MALTRESTSYTEGYRDGRDSCRPELARWRERYESSGAAWALDAEARYAAGIKAGIAHATLVVVAVGIVAGVVIAAWHGGGVG